MNRLFQIFWLGLLVWNTAIGDSEVATVASVDRILTASPSIEAFLQDKNAQDEYYAELSRYYGDRLSRSDFDTILKRVSYLIPRVPGLSERLWSVRSGNPFEIEADRHGFGRTVNAPVWDAYWAGYLGKLSSESQNLYQSMTGGVPDVYQLANAIRGHVVSGKDRTADPVVDQFFKLLIEIYFQRSDIQQMLNNRDGDAVLTLLENLRNDPRPLLEQYPGIGEMPIELSKPLLPQVETLLADETMLPRAPQGDAKKVFRFEPWPRGFHTLFGDAARGDKFGTAPARFLVHSAPGAHYHNLTRDGEWLGFTSLLKGNVAANGYFAAEFSTDAMDSAERHANGTKGPTLFEKWLPRVTGYDGPFTRKDELGNSQLPPKILIGEKAREGAGGVGRTSAFIRGLPMYRLAPEVGETFYMHDEVGRTASDRASRLWGRRLIFEAGLPGAGKLRMLYPVNLDDALGAEAHGVEKMSQEEIEAVVMSLGEEARNLNPDAFFVRVAKALERVFQPKVRSALLGVLRNAPTLTPTLEQTLSAELKSREPQVALAAATVLMHFQSPRSELLEPLARCLNQDEMRWSFQEESLLPALIRASKSPEFRHATLEKFAEYLLSRPTTRFNENRHAAFFSALFSSANYANDARLVAAMEKRLSFPKIAEMAKNAFAMAPEDSLLVSQMNNWFGSWRGVKKDTATAALLARQETADEKVIAYAMKGMRKVQGWQRAQLLMGLAPQLAKSPEHKDTLILMLNDGSAIVVDTAANALFRTDANQLSPLQAAKIRVSFAHLSTQLSPQTVAQYGHWMAGYPESSQEDLSAATAAQKAVCGGFLSRFFKTRRR